VVLLEEAAAWYVRMENAPDAALRRAFDTWLATSEAHARAYDQVRSAHNQTIALAREPALLALRHEAVARAMLGRPRRRFGSRPIAAAIVLLAAAPLAAWSVAFWLPRHSAPRFEETFRTGVAQQADVTLPDGSKVRLDTATRLRVSFGAKERRVKLDGQGWFEVAPSDRPFVIDAGDRELNAGAGKFDVRTDPGLVRAFADSGRLSVVTGSSSIALGNGKLLTVRGDEASIRRLDDPVSFTGWRNGLLQFNDVSLAAAVGELNRYRRKPIRVADAEAADLRISGSFRTTETPAFVDALRRGFPVVVKQDDPASVVIASR